MKKKTEDALKALQTAGQMIGEVLKQLTEDKFIIKASSYHFHLALVFYFNPPSLFDNIDGYCTLWPL